MLRTFTSQGTKSEEKTTVPFSFFCIWHQWDFQMTGVSILIRKSWIILVKFWFHSEMDRVALCLQLEHETSNVGFFCQNYALNFHLQPTTTQILGGLYEASHNFWASDPPYTLVASWGSEVWHRAVGEFAFMLGMNYKTIRWKMLLM